MLKYRTNCSGKDSSEDLLRTVCFIRDHAKKLEVDNEKYSLWERYTGRRLDFSGNRLLEKEHEIVKY